MKIPILHLFKSHYLLFLRLSKYSASMMAKIAGPTVILATTVPLGFLQEVGQQQHLRIASWE